MFHDNLQKGYLKLIYKQFIASIACNQYINRIVIFTYAINAQMCSYFVTINACIVSTKLNWSFLV